MEAYNIFKDLAIIIVFAKLFGIAARKCKAPQVVGEILAGLLIGPSVLGLVQQSDFLVQMAEVGVVLLMFSAGLETDLKELMKTGPVAFLIACAGVFIPLIGGTLLYMGFYGASPFGSESFYMAVFIGVIMTATSVSITVQSLKEMGRLKGKVGTTILSAAIIDDVIGIILSLALCFFFAYAAERYFGIADITGAYVAGVVLCSIQDSSYIDQKMEISSYMIFGPVFFASIGFKTSIDHLNSGILLFSIAFVLVALITKIIGCGIMARICKFSIPDSIKIGVGMMTRGEVALIVAQKGLSVGLLTSEYFTAVILLIIASSVSTPILLKLLYARHDAA